MVTVVENAAQHEAATVRPEVISAFRKHSGSVLGGFFGAAAFDEVALVPVAAAVDKTGRFAANFADRGVRQQQRPVLLLGIRRQRPVVPT